MLYNNPLLLIIVPFQQVNRLQRRTVDVTVTGSLVVGTQNH
jgi:hypothetical protein